MGFLAFLSIVVVALIVGVGVQLLFTSSNPYEWLAVAVAFAFGAYFASQSFVGSTVFAGIKDWGPTLDGLYLVPAIAGGVILAVVAALGIRTSPPRSIRT